MNFIKKENLKEWKKNIRNVLGRDTYRIETVIYTIEDQDFDYVMCYNKKGKAIKTLDIIKENEYIQKMVNKPLNFKKIYNGERIN